jgi:ADP-L-glycero-D-manno-heptose 6-epimerase
MIVVTGGGGFIGSAIIWKLNKLDISNILAVDKFAKLQKYKNLDFLKYSSVLDKDTFLENIESGKYDNILIDSIIHMGACSATTEYNMDFLMKNNFEYTKKLCEYSVSRGIRFIYASSAATYGDGSAGYDDDTDKLDELKPLNPYGMSKHLFDNWARDNGMFEKITGLKYFNVYGPNEYHKKDMCSVVFKCYNQIKQTGKARLFKTTSDKYGDGEQKRDFIYIKDAVDMTLHFYFNKDINGLFNVGTGNANSFNSFVKPIFKALNQREEIEYFEMPEILIEKYQDYTCANMEKLRQTGYIKSIYNIDEAVSEYVSGYLEKENQYLRS